eukprot:superscaffoldBa00000224_g2896
MKRRSRERLTDSDLPLFICPLALGARAAGTIGRRLEEIKRAVARSWFRVGCMDFKESLKEFQRSLRVATGGPSLVDVEKRAWWLEDGTVYNGNYSDSLGLKVFGPDEWEINSVCVDNQKQSESKTHPEDREYISSNVSVNVKPPRNNPVSYGEL